MLSVIAARESLTRAIIDFLEQFNDGEGATDSQGSRVARALNAALRTLALDAVADNPEPDAEAFREWMIEPIDETKMMDELPKGPEEKETISEEAITEVKKHLDALAQAIGLVSYVRKHRPRRKATACASGRRVRREAGRGHG